MQQEQNTIKISLGIISYLRNLFSEESFRNEKVDGMNLKVLINTPETVKMVEWIKNLSENEENIHKIQLGIYQSNNFNNNNIINSNINEKLMELYSINLKEKMNYKAFCKALQKMETLKGKFIIKLKIFTTAFIEIGGFKKSTEIWNLEGMKESEMTGIKIFYNDTNDVNIKNVNRCINEGINNKCINTSINNKCINEGINNTSTNNNTITTTNNNTNNTPISTTNDNIKCPCTINNNEPNMILCTRCLSWVHSTCHGFFSSKDKRIGRSFQCFHCSNTVNKEIRDCCIYRRVLNFMYNEEEEFLNRDDVNNFIMKRLGTSNSFTGSLVTRLLQDGFIRKMTDKMEIMKNKEIKEKIKEYFNGKRMECFVCMEGIEIDA